MSRMFFGDQSDSPVHGKIQHMQLWIQWKVTVWEENKALLTSTGYFVYVGGCELELELAEAELNYTKCRQYKCSLAENTFTTYDKINKGMNEQINDPITLADTQIHRLRRERWQTNLFRSR